MSAAPSLKAYTLKVPRNCPESHKGLTQQSHSSHSSLSQHHISFHSLSQTLRPSTISSAHSPQPIDLPALQPRAGRDLSRVTGTSMSIFLHAFSCSRVAPSCSPLLLRCSLAAPFKAAMLPFPIEKGNPRTQVRGIYIIYIYRIE